MKRQIAAFALLSSIANTVTASAKLGDVTYGNQEPGTYCITYLFTYLAPISMGTELPEPSQNSTEPEQTTSSDADEPGRFSTDIEPSLVTTLSPQEPSSVPASQSTSVDFDPTGQRIIFAVTPAEGTRKRDIGGFVGDDICTFATVFTLGNGRLFEGGVPISYLGDAFQLLQSSSLPSGDDITTTFSNNGGSLSFINPGLPGSQASFCQTSSDGAVYMTFTSRPQGCVPVRLTIYGVERCINGRIDGLDTSTAAATQEESTQAAVLPSTEDPLPTSLLPPDMTDEETVFPTLTIDPTRPLSFSNFTSQQSTVKVPSFTSGIVLPSLSPSRSDEPTVVETETLAPTFATTSEEVKSSFEADTTELSSTAALPVLESTSSEGEFPTSSSPASTTDEVSFSSSTLPLPTESSSLTETSDVSNIITTSFESTTEVPTTTISMETTTTEDIIIITNAIANGRFAMPNLNSVGDIMGFQREGLAEYRDGNCYKGDEGTDDGCVVLKTADGRKRNADSFSGISQMLTSLSPSRTVLYTLQFYYVVIEVGPSQACTIDAYLGTLQAFSQTLSIGDGEATSWKRALTAVRADAESASLSISISCSGRGVTMVYVDSVFFSNKVTPDNIDTHRLEFRDAEVPPQQSTVENTPTTVSQTTTASATPTEICKYTHGEECQFDSQKNVPDALCAFEGFFTGDTWKESRTDYPHQDNREQCIAICKSLPDCQASGHFQNENRCLFTTTVITENDFIIYDEGEFWKQASWADQRCWTCPDCIDESVPNMPAEKCSYTQGDVCTRHATPASIVCNTAGWMSGGYISGEYFVDQYPHQESPEACAAICRALFSCKGSSFYGGICLFSTTVLSTTDGPFPLVLDRDPSWNSVWDDSGCFVCPGCTD
ncbi:unnamed protein product [Fusarium graminearum]|uniref:Chromosome 2, complete genome n=1 Tax=Gibberella zeae (strain ATCC MYA-4620 / CBS 123657 / FGSC 9075 / NRRL 31084 / PH-1) TaxID=229533 RepID=A0A098DHA8_GIBZE|nr:unnamed protein product [Fusarium graminearum]